MNCKKCNGPVTSTDLFCATCGANVKEQMSENSNSQVNIPTNNVEIPVMNVANNQTISGSAFVSSPDTQSGNVQSFDNSNLSQPSEINTGSVSVTPVVTPMPSQNVAPVATPMQVQDVTPVQPQNVAPVATPMQVQDVTPVQSQNVAPVATPMPSQNVAQTTNNSKTLSTVSVVLGILALVISVFLFKYVFVGLVFSIVGLVLAGMYKKKTGNKTKGKVLNIIGLILTIIGSIFRVLILIGISFFSSLSGIESIPDISYDGEVSTDDMAVQQTLFCTYGDMITLKDVTIEYSNNKATKYSMNLDITNVDEKSNLTLDKQKIYDLNVGIFEKIKEFNDFAISYEYYSTGTGVKGKLEVELNELYTDSENKVKDALNLSDLTSDKEYLESLNHICKVS